ncbi:MAG: flavodoxin family protein [Paludibacteraceae bacterium]|nr:flavodoxin family protein [Paludibacteraceae bacterium]
MKVLLVNGSPRKNGNTFTALSEIARTLSDNGIESEIVWIGNKPIRGCIACGKCKSGIPYPDGHKGCVFNDDICNDISSKFEGADGFVFGSPVYYGQPNGALLCLMQRSFFSNGAAVQNKPAAVVTICRRGGATAAFQCLQMPLQMMNMPIATSQYWNIAYGREQAEASKDTEGMQTMRTLGNNLAWMLKGLRGESAPVCPEREDWQPMHFIR